MLRGKVIWLAAAGVAALVACGCGPQPYRYGDYESFVRPGVVPASYKRAAVLYVGYASGSSALQKDPATNIFGAQSTATPNAMESEHSADDVVLYSNALINALASRGVQVIERNKVNDLVREQGLIQQELVDLSDLEKVRRLGKLLKVDLLVRGTLIAERGGWYLTPNLEPYYIALTGLSVTGVDTRTGQVVWVDTTYLAQRITPRQLRNQPDQSSTSSVMQIIDEMVARFISGGAQ
jgi:hypothetical protein